MKFNDKIVAQGPRNEFQEVFLIEILGEAGIPAKLVSLSVIQSPIPDQDYGVGVAVAERDYPRAREIIHHTINRSKICLRCESFIRPGKSICPRCGEPADPRDPDEIRKAYHRDHPTTGE